MKVLQAERNRPARAHGFERVGQLPKHPIARHSDAAPLQRRDLRGRLERGQLRQPRRCATAQQGDVVLALVLPAEPGQRLEQRLVGFAGSVLLDAVGSRDAPSDLVVECRRERPRRAPSCRFRARLSGRRSVSTPVRASADERASCASAASRPTIDPAGWASGVSTGRSTAAVAVGGAGRQKPEAAPVHRLDEPRRTRIVLERLSQLLNAGRQRGVADGCVRPDRSKQLFLGDDLLGSLDERAQHRERLRRDAGRPACLASTPASDAGNSGRSESVDLRARCCSCRNPAEIRNDGRRPDPNLAKDCCRKSCNPISTASHGRLRHLTASERRLRHLSSSRRCSARRHGSASRLRKEFSSDES